MTDQTQVTTPAPSGEVAPSQGQQPAAPQPGTPEYDAAMAAKYQAAQQSQGTTPEPTPEAQPPAQSEGELILGKFKSVDDLAKAYTELQKKLGQPREQTTEQSPEQTPEGQSEGKTPLQVPEQEQPQPTALETVLTKAASEYENGLDISGETREELVKAGIPAQMIDTYLVGLKVQAEAVRNEAFSLVGGEQNYFAMIEWAKTLPEAERNAFNEAVVNPATSQLAIKGLYAKFVEANGNERPLATTTADVTGANTDVYRSKAELTTDMRDPRYASDPAFRAQVAAKLQRSRAAGTLGPLGVSYS